MPNLATALKSEIARVARKELRNEIEPLKRAIAAQRAAIAKLRQQLQEQQRLLRHSSKRGGSGFAPPDLASEKQLRFSPTRLKKQRQKLDLSAETFGKLVGASGQSVYLWESGRTRPSASSLAAIAALRGIGKRELQGRLDALP